MGRTPRTHHGLTRAPCRRLDVRAPLLQHDTDGYHVTGLLLYDSDCGICLATAAWLAKRVVASRLGLLPLSDAGSEPRVGRLTRGRPLVTTIHFVRADDTILTGARAVLAAVRLVPRWRFLAIVLDNGLGHAFLEPLYRQIAAHRRRIGRVLGLPVSCPLPPRKGESV